MNVEIVKGVVYPVCPHCRAVQKYKRYSYYSDVDRDYPMLQRTRCDYCEQPFDIPRIERVTPK